jgi:hypothetical protein
MTGPVAPVVVSSATLEIFTPSALQPSGPSCAQCRFPRRSEETEGLASVQEPFMHVGDPLRA